MIPPELGKVANGHHEWYPGDRGYRYAPITPAELAAQLAARDSGYTQERLRVRDERRQLIKKWQAERDAWIAAGAPERHPRYPDWIWY